MSKISALTAMLCLACTSLHADVPYQLWVTQDSDDSTPLTAPLVVKPDSSFELTVWYSAPDIDPSPEKSYGLLSLEVCLGWDTTTQSGPSAVPIKHKLQLDGSLTEALTVYQAGPGGNALCGFRAAAGSPSDSERPYGLQYSHASLQGFPASSAQKLFSVRLRNNALQPGESMPIVVWDAGSNLSYTSFMTPQDGQIIRLGTQSITVSCTAECCITGKVIPGVSRMAGHIEIIPDGQMTPAETVAVTPDDTGAFMVNTSLSGLHTLRFVWDHHLTHTLKAVDVVGQTSLPVDIVLINGDANNDGQINLFDFVVLDTNFGKSTPSADLDGDGIVNLFDYVIIDQNFGAQD
ncbi:MAG: dockerin type I repeat-containing protein [Armatimonadota bacterium]